MTSSDGVHEVLEKQVDTPREVRLKKFVNLFWGGITIDGKRLGTFRSRLKDMRAEMEDEDDEDNAASERIIFMYGPLIGTSEFYDGKITRTHLYTIWKFSPWGRAVFTTAAVLAMVPLLLIVMTMIAALAGIAGINSALYAILPVLFFIITGTALVLPLAIRYKLAKHPSKKWLKDRQDYITKRRISAAIYAAGGVTNRTRTDAFSPKLAATLPGIRVLNPYSKKNRLIVPTKLFGDKPIKAQYYKFPLPDGKPRLELVANMDILKDYMGVESMEYIPSLTDRGHAGFLCQQEDASFRPAPFTQALFNRKSSKENPYEVVLARDSRGGAVTVDMHRKRMVLSGASGSGKSSTMSSILMQMLYKRFDVYGIDLKNELFDAFLYAGGSGIKGVATNAYEADQMMGYLMEELKLRTASKARVANNPPIVVFIDEMNGLSLDTEGGKDSLFAVKGSFHKSLSILMTQGRSLGMSAVLASQQFNAKVASTTIRGQLDYRFLLKTPDPVAQQMVLPDIPSELEKDVRAAMRGFIDPRDPSGTKTIAGIGYLQTAGLPKRVRGLYLETLSENNKVLKPTDPPEQIVKLAFENLQGPRAMTFKTAATEAWREIVWTDRPTQMARQLQYDGSTIDLTDIDPATYVPYHSGMSKAEFVQLLVPDAEQEDEVRKTYTETVTDGMVIDEVEAKRMSKTRGNSQLTSQANQQRAAALDALGFTDNDFNSEDFYVSHEVEPEFDPGQLSVKEHMRWKEEQEELAAQQVREVVVTPVRTNASYVNAPVIDHAYVVANRSEDQQRMIEQVNPLLREILLDLRWDYVNVRSDISPSHWNETVIKAFRKLPESHPAETEDERKARIRARDEFTRKFSPAEWLALRPLLLYKGMTYELDEMDDAPADGIFYADEMAEEHRHQGKPQYIVLKQPKEVPKPPNKEVIAEAKLRATTDKKNFPAMRAFLLDLDFTYEEVKGKLTASQWNDTTLAKFRSNPDTAAAFMSKNLDRQPHLLHEGKVGVPTPIDADARIYDDAPSRGVNRITPPAKFPQEKSLAPINSPSAPPAPRPQTSAPQGARPNLVNVDGESYVKVSAAGEAITVTEVQVGGKIIRNAPGVNPVITTGEAYRDAIDAPSYPTQQSITSAPTNTDSVVDAEVEEISSEDTSPKKYYKDVYSDDDVEPMQSTPEYSPDGIYPEY